MNQKILLIDDREDNLFALESLLEPEGYHIVKARSGKDGLKILLHEVDFALILMDVQMPNLNGFETAALIFERERLKHIPIIFITAISYGEENIIKGYRTGAIDYIYKPINPELLKAKVSVFIDLYNKSQQLILQEQKIRAINKNLQNEIKERIASEEKIIVLNRQLLRNIEGLEKANKELDRFAFMASHDLQEPLRKIKVFCDRFYKKNSHLNNEDIKDILRIDQSASRMQDLINDILDFSKLNAEFGDFRETSLTGLVSEVIEDLEPLIQEKHAEVHVTELPTLPVYERLMKPVFSNLLNNSIKYARKNVAPVIHIFSESFEGDNLTPRPSGPEKFVRIYVKDNGIGFNQQYAEQIFEMFKRLHNSPEYEGTGVGLALCKRIMEKHHGFISAISDENEGSTFILSIPTEQPVFQK